MDEYKSKVIDKYNSFDNYEAFCYSNELIKFLNIADIADKKGIDSLTQRQRDCLMSFLNDEKKMR